MNKWGLLKTIINKLIENLNSSLNNVIDFSCISLLKLSKINYVEFLNINESDNKPYLIFLINNIKNIINNNNIKQKQKLILYESIGNLINKVQKSEQVRNYLNELTNEIFNKFNNLFDYFKTNHKLFNKEEYEFFNEFILINEKLIFTLNNFYWEFNIKTFNQINEICLFIGKNIEKEENLKINIIANFLSLMNILIQNINDKNLIIIFPEIEKNIKEFLTNNLYNFKPIIILKNFLILFISICQKNQIKQFEFLISKFLSKCNNFFINNYVIGKDSLIDYLKLLQIIFSFEKNYLNNETKIFDDIFNFINKIIYEFDPKINNEIVITLTIFTNEIILKNKINVKNYYLKSLQIIIYLIINPFYSNVSFTTKVEIFEKLIKAYNNF